MASMGNNMGDGIAPSPGAPLLGNVRFMPPGFEDCAKKPFTYNIVFNPIGAQTLVQSVNINNDSYFVVTTQTATIWDYATQYTTNITTDLFPAFVQILDTSSGAFNMNGGVPFGSYFGSAKQPFVWLYRAQLYAPGGQITVTLQSLLAAQQTVTLSFTGFKVFGYADVAPAPS
jgi:hypothetical protein